MQIYAQRRARVLDAMLARGGGVAIQPTAPERLRNGDSDYVYRHDSAFYYLTGFTEPGAVLVLIADARGGGRREAILFCRAKDPEREIWDGMRWGPDAAREHFLFDAAHPIDELDAQMPQLIADTPALFYPLPGAAGTTARLAAELEEQVQRWRTAVRAMARQGIRVPALAHDLVPLLDEMRLIKDASEIETMRRAAQIAAAAHVRAIQKCRAGWAEYRLEAELLHEFRRHGGEPAYTPIVAAGANACILHHHPGATPLSAGELCLIDAGCEWGSYASDVTRTFPVGGRYSGEQRAVYEIVLAAQDAAFAQVRPGASWNAPHDAAVRVLTQGMLDLGLLTGSVDGAIESGAYRQFYMHRTGHWLGLDVHDVGDYRELGDVEDAGDVGHVGAGNSGAATAASSAQPERPWRKLVPGMVLTVEPGFYIRPAANVPLHYAHIGVRIEDDVLVTANGCEVLSHDAPRLAADVEAAMRG
jgi:Xaa-Pro aminopeptidase